jgi:pSer/pThr/pTyr-binding forkhead associated (FHA) protein
MRYQVQIARGPDTGCRFPLQEGSEAVIGRGLECTVALDDPSVSRRHCRIVVENSRVTLYDADSRWGTLVNGTPVTCQELEIGDQISIGETVLRLEAATAPDATTVARPVSHGRQRQAPMKLEPLPPAEPSIHR